MRKYRLDIIIYVIFVSAGFRCYSQPDQKEYFVQPCEFICDYPFDGVNKLAVTCRVWGLLKYFHPNVTAGKLDWDQVLIDRLAKIDEAETSEQVNAELMQMIQIAGEYEVQKDTTWNDSLNMNVNLCWLDNSFINDSIRNVLMEIASLKIEQPSYYLKPSDLNLPDFNEKDYDLELIFQFEYLRLLALFRYWNVIYYFYPYKYLMDQSWDVTLSEFIPQFMTANEVHLYHKVVNKLANKLNDGHALTSVAPLYSKAKHKYITLIDSSTIVRTIPEESLLKRGDIILSIDGQDIWSYRDSIAALLPWSNIHDRDNTVNGNIYYCIMKGCILTIKREQKEYIFRENTKSIPIKTNSSTPHHLITPDIAYVDLDILKASDIPSMMDSLKNCMGIIFDLRNYPSNFKQWDIFCHISLTQEYQYGLGTFVDFFHYGAFYEYECFTKCPDELWYSRNKYNGRVAVLINEGTMSWAETLSMAFRIHEAILIGAPTAGSNGDVVNFSLPGRITVCFSGIGFYFPDGTQTQRKGIIPDIEVYPTMDDIMAGRDEVLEAAITYLNSN